MNFSLINPVADYTVSIYDMTGRQDLYRLIADGNIIGSVVGMEGIQMDSMRNPVSIYWIIADRKKYTAKCGDM